MYHWGLSLSFDSAWRIISDGSHIRQVKLPTANYLDIRSLIFFFRALRMRLTLSRFRQLPETRLTTQHQIGH